MPENNDSENLAVMSWRLTVLEGLVNAHTAKLEHVATQADVSTLKDEIRAIVPSLIKVAFTVFISLGTLAIMALGLLHQLGKL